MPKTGNRRGTPRYELIGLTEVAEQCGVTYRTAYRWVTSGKLKATRVGPKLWKVRRVDVDKMLAPVGGGE